MRIIIAFNNRRSPTNHMWLLEVKWEMKRKTRFVFISIIYALIIVLILLLTEMAIICKAKASHMVIDDEMLFRIGISAIVCSLILIAIGIPAFSKKNQRINRRLEEEYGLIEDKNK